MTAFFDLPPMLVTDASFDDLVGASDLAAIFALCPVFDADSSFDDLVGASITTAIFALCPVFDADSSFDGFVGASITTAKFVRCPVLITHSPPDGYIATSFSGSILDLQWRRLVSWHLSAASRVRQRYICSGRSPVLTPSSYSSTRIRRNPPCIDQV